MSSDDEHPQSPATEPARILRLLWRRQLGEEEGARGPRKRLNLDRIVDAAIDHADREGLGSLSMRRIAELLDTSATSLYTYVPGRGELIGLMVDQVVGRTPLHDHAGSLRERLAAIAELLWGEHHRHPWLSDAQSHRPWIGPNISARYEWELAAMEGQGFGDIEMDHAVALIESHAAACAGSSIQAARMARQSGISDMEWWTANAPILDEVMPADEFPISSRVGSAVGMEYGAVTSHRAVFEFGLEVILDGIDARRGGA